MNSIDALIPELQQPARDLVQLAGTAGVQPRVTSTLRTRTEQERLWRRFQQGLTRYPVAPPGSSAHEFGYAFDMVVSPPEENLVDLGTVWRQWGGKWGASDPIHFEYPGFTPPSPTADRAPPGIFSIPGAIDFLIGLNPFIGYVELMSTILTWFPWASENQVLQFLSGPAEYIATRY